MLEAAAGDLIVVRYEPLKVPKLMKEAQGEYDYRKMKGRTPLYGISTFGRIVQPNQSVDQTVRQICLASGLTGGRWVYPIRAAELEDAGFPVEEDPPDEEPNHYCAMLGSELNPRDVERVVELLEPYRREKPG